jgi:hypothetical protein
MIILKLQDTFKALCELLKIAIVIRFVKEVERKIFYFNDCLMNWKNCDRVV